jgi:D-arabinose 1-dehydrogenase-like Zn-dependent alcohol dehydrogenase
MVDFVQREGIEVHTTLYKIEELEKLTRDCEKPNVKGKLVLSME